MLDTQTVQETTEQTELFLRLFIGNSSELLDEIPHVEGTSIDIDAIAKYIVDTYEEYSDWDWRELRSELYININI